MQFLIIRWQIFQLNNAHFDYKIVDVLRSLIFKPKENFNKNSHFFQI